MTMRLMEKLLGGLVVLGEVSYGKWQLRRFLPGIIVVAWLVITVAISASAILIGGFYACYLVLLHHGMDAQSAIFIALLLLAMMTALFVLVTLTCLHHAQGAPKLWRQFPLTARAGEALDAFLEGFNG